MVETSTYFTQDSVVTWGLPILNFAKLIIQLLEGSFTDAETTLSYLLLQQHAPEQLVLEAVRRYCIELQTKGSGASDSLFFKAWRFYQQAIEK